MQGHLVLLSKSKMAPLSFLCTINREQGELPYVPLQSVAVERELSHLLISSLIFYDSFLLLLLIA